LLCRWYHVMSPDISIDVTEVGGDHLLLDVEYQD
jgi:hypothetical protein